MIFVENYIGLNIQAAIRGPVGSPYEGGLFYLYMKVQILTKDFYYIFRKFFCHMKMNKGNYYDKLLALAGI